MGQCERDDPLESRGICKSSQTSLLTTKRVTRYNRKKSLSISTSLLFYTQSIIQKFQQCKTTTPKTMKAIIFTDSPTTTYTKPAPVTSLILNHSQPTPIPSPTQHLIRIHASAITPYELSWPTAGFPHPEPRIPCHDTAGTIIYLFPSRLTFPTRR